MDYLNERKVVVKEEPQQSMVDCLIVICLISLRGDKEPRKEDGNIVRNTCMINI